MTDFRKIEVRSLGRPSVVSLADAAICRALSEEFLIFDTFVSGEARVDLSPLVLPFSMHQAAVEAAEAVASVTFRTGEVALGDAAEAELYGLAPDIVSLARASYQCADVEGLARVDLLLSEHGNLLGCELNADCPGGHNETVALPRLAVRQGLTQLTNPTTTVPVLVDRLIELSGGRGSPLGVIGLVYATAYAEDLQVCAFLEREIKRRGGRAVRAPLTMFRAGPADTVVARGERVSVMYRYLPLEYMEGAPENAMLERAVRSGKLRTFSSFSHIFAQSKLSMARMPEDFEYVPETYLLREVEMRDLVQNRGEWVIKRALGRVGDEVFVGPLHAKEDWAEVVRETALLARTEPWIAQRFVHQRPISTPWGPLFLTLGAYVQNGRFSGYFARLSEVSHASHDALVVPVFVERPAGEVAA